MKIVFLTILLKKGMLCLEPLALTLRHLRPSYTQNVNFELAVFGLDMWQVYLGNLKDVALNDIFFLLAHCTQSVSMLVPPHRVEQVHMVIEDNHCS